MVTSGVKRGADDGQESDDHPFRMARARVEVPPLQAEASTTLEQRVAHMELQVDSLNTFAGMVEQFVPRFREMYDRMGVMETNMQNTGNNIQQLVNQSVNEQHLQIQKQLEETAANIPNMKARIDKVMLEADHQIQQRLLELVSDDKRIEANVQQVAKCMEAEVGKIKACTEAEMERVKARTAEEFEAVKNGIEQFAAQHEQGNRMSMLEVGMAQLTSDVNDAKQKIQNNFQVHEEVVQTVNSRVEDIEHGIRQQPCHCPCVEAMKGQLMNVENVVKRGVPLQAPPQTTARACTVPGGLGMPHQPMGSASMPAPTPQFGYSANGGTTNPSLLLGGVWRGAAASYGHGQGAGGQGPPHGHGGQGGDGYGPPGAPHGRGQPGGAGGGGGPPGGPPGGPGMAPGFGQPGGNGRGIDLYTKLFDVKIAQSPEYQYHGLEGGMAWRQKVRNYLTGQCPDCDPLLNWAEAHESSITWTEIQWVGNPMNGQLALDQDACIIAGHIWTFLGVCLKGKAEAVYNTGGTERIRNGLEAWRKVYCHIVNGSKLHNMNLRDRVYQPKEARQYSDVPQAIGDWENDYRDFLAGHGGRMTAYEEKMTVLKILPSSMRDHLLYRAMDDQMSYEQFRDVCIHRVSELKFLSGNHKALVAHDEPIVEPPPDLALEDEEAMAARFEKKGWKVVPPSRLKTFNTTRAAPGGARPGGSKCINCGGAHATRDCTRGRVNESERPCWGCGQKGHKQSACPSNPSAPRRSVPARAAAEELEERVMTCVEGDQKQSWSRPRSLKIQDFLIGDAKSLISDEENVQKTVGEVGCRVQCSPNSFLHEGAVPLGPVPGFMVSADEFPPLTSYTRQTERTGKSAMILPRTTSNARSKTGCSNCVNCSNSCVLVATETNNGGVNNSCVQQATSSGVHGGDVLSYESPKGPQAGDAESSTPLSDLSYERNLMSNNVQSGGRLSYESPKGPQAGDAESSRPLSNLSYERNLMSADATSSTVRPVPTRADVRSGANNGGVVNGANHGGVATRGASTSSLYDKHSTTNSQRPTSTRKSPNNTTTITSQPTSNSNHVPFGVRGDVAFPADEPLPGETPSPGRAVSGAGNDVFVCAEEELDVPVYELDDDEFEEMVVTVTADSGAGNHIVNKLDIGAYNKRVEPSPASRAGKGFVAANDHRIPNEGQVTLRLQGEEPDDEVVNSVFQVAEVNRPLMSIGRICDQGHRVCFDSEKAEVICKKTNKVVMVFKRKNGGLYTADLVLRAPKKRNDGGPARPKGFGGHGR